MHASSPTIRRYFSFSDSMNSSDRGGSSSMRLFGQTGSLAGVSFSQVAGVMGA
ncbi:hypothetical protein [Methylobacter luteus]|uniref:hypothetical protein n=1 Tax=Methylobacter luteus TaxID=415 RepID=UPI000411D6D3|nr:hypothetical protein [Methylobacter luteus]